jgi:hypothetical protein
MMHACLLHSLHCSEAQQVECAMHLAIKFRSDVVWAGPCISRLLHDAVIASPYCTAALPAVSIRQRFLMGVLLCSAAAEETPSWPLSRPMKRTG